jgi:hypothetical protein
MSLLISSIPSEISLAARLRKAILRTVPVRINVVNVLGPDTILNLLNYLLGITGATNTISTIKLAKMASQN